VERILDAVKEADLSDDQVHDLAVAVAEALSNAAVHGNALQPDASVRVVVEVTPRRGAVVDVKDSGRGFDFSAISDPTDPSRILVPGGRGVFLMRRLVDQLEFSDHGSRVRLVMERHREDGRGPGRPSKLEGSKD
jgi:anti-sigma regulatory factor (Ser/Thr protein kinase)